eukprot:scaffold147131_cov32-Tisochrysis_lutea.AAC.2
MVPTIPWTRRHRIERKDPLAAVRIIHSDLHKGGRQELGRASRTQYAIMRPVFKSTIRSYGPYEGEPELLCVGVAVPRNAVMRNWHMCEIHDIFAEEVPTIWKLASVPRQHLDTALERGVVELGNKSRRTECVGCMRSCGSRLEGKRLKRSVRGSVWPHPQKSIDFDSRHCIARGFWVGPKRLFLVLRSLRDC